MFVCVCVCVCVCVVCVFVLPPLSEVGIKVIIITSATLARATRVVIHSIFLLGPSALGMVESYLHN